MSQPPPYQHPGQPYQDQPYQGQQYQGQQYQGGPYPGQYPGYPPPQPRGTNGMAIAALVCLFLFAPASILLGSMARKQIRQTGEEGWGMATVSMIIGIVLTVIGVLAVILLVVMSVMLVNQLPPPR
ncbi:DUF4190 domain-containing protein [Actinosynnema sp. NPDC059797]